MNSKRIQWVTLGLALFSGALGRAEVGEFTLSEKLLNQIEFSGTQTEPFTKRGRYIEPNITIKVSPKLGDSNPSGKFFLDIDLDGTSRSYSTTPVGRNHSVKATVDSRVKADFEQEIILGKDGLESGKFTGKVDITPQKTSFSNDFKLLNGIVNKKAQQKAPAQIASELPREKAELEERIGSEVDKGIGEARKLVDSTLQVLAPAVSDKEKFPFDTKLTTKAGKDGQIKFEISDFGKPIERSPKPQFENKAQLMTTGVVHQDLLTKSVASEIAGKELKMSQLRKVLCSPRIQKLIDFCKLEIDEEAEQMSLVFDSEKPIEFIFDQGHVTMRLNASYRTGIAKTDSEDRALLSNPGATKPQFETVPYQLEVSYKVQGGTAKLEKLTVTEKDPVQMTPGGFLSHLLGRGTHADGGSKPERPTAENLLSPVIKFKIQNEFKKILSENVDFHSATIPTKVKTTIGPKGKEIQILEAGSLLPVEVKSESGWLAIGNTFCNDSNKPFGAVFSQDGKIKNVESGSPAELTGFEPGDTIKTFSEPEGRSNAFTGGADAFVSFIKEKAANKFSKDRKVIMGGTDKSGQSFTRTVFLCPSELNHKQRAQQTILRFQTK